MKRVLGFTVVELLVVIVVVGILAGVTIISYGSWQHNTANTSVKSDIQQATAGLSSYKNFKNTYPPNLAGTDFASSENVALTLYTNAPSVGVYDELTSDQNAQLFLNTCNANLESSDNTACVFNGKNGGAKIHVKGTSSSNMIWSPSPITTDYLRANCGSLCSNVETMISQFEVQGGSFPLVLSGTNTSLPEPTQVPNGVASEYCLEGRAGDFTDIAYHSTSASREISQGPCPDNPDLHYYP
ncbi:MAG TPA: prepilin-type N-terminal cleavage/methylation domain-containing protein [Candidatus Saccharimonadales bacterium]